MSGSKSKTNTLKKRKSESSIGSKLFKSKSTKKPVVEKKVTFGGESQVLIPGRQQQNLIPPPPTTAPPPLPQQQPQLQAVIPPPPQTLPPPLPQNVPQNVPSITLPATGPGQPLALQGRRTATQSGKSSRGRTGAVELEQLKDTDDVDIRDLDENGAVVRLILKGMDQGTVKLARSALLALNVQQLQQGELVRLIQEAERIYLQIKDLPDTAQLNLPLGVGEVALAMRTRKRIEDRLAGMVRIDQPDVLPLRQLTALTGFLQNNAGLVDYLQKADIGFLFGSNGARGQGGGVFKNGNIHTLGKEDLEGRKWLQLVVHEAGHATYQRRLLGNKTVDTFLDNGTLGELRARRDQIRVDAAGDPVPPDDPTSRFHAELTAIEKELADNGGDQLWNDMIPDAQALYMAWITLRQNGAADLQGIDMGPGMSPPERLEYQRKNFIEFIAESFMHVATDEIEGHMQHIASDTTVSEKSKDAWRTALTILDKHVRDKILGWDAMW